MFFILLLLMITCSNPTDFFHNLSVSKKWNNESWVVQKRRSVFFLNLNIVLCLVGARARKGGWLHEEEPARLISRSHGVKVIFHLFDINSRNCCSQLIWFVSGIQILNKCIFFKIVRNGSQHTTHLIYSYLLFGN